MLEKQHLTNFCLEPKECSPLDYKRQREKRAPFQKPVAARNSILARDNPAVHRWVQPGCFNDSGICSQGIRWHLYLASSPLQRCIISRGVKEAAYVQLAHLVVGVALGEVLHVGQLQVHLCEPHQNALPGPLKFLPLIGEMLQKGRRDHICADGWVRVQADSKVTAGWTGSWNTHREICLWVLQREGDTTRHSGTSMGSGARGLALAVWYQTSSSTSVSLGVFSGKWESRDGDYISKVLSAFEILQFSSLSQWFPQSPGQETPQSPRQAPCLFLPISHH